MDRCWGSGRYHPTVGGAISVSVGTRARFGLLYRIDPTTRENIVPQSGPGELVAGEVDPPLAATIHLI